MLRCSEELSALLRGEGGSRSAAREGGSRPAAGRAPRSAAGESFICAAGGRA
jgi:hypothetical protein